jgi:hypothetical protein
MEKNKYVELVEKMEEVEDIVECKECFDLFPKVYGIKLDLGYLCPTCGCAEECEEEVEDIEVADEDIFKLDFPELKKFRDEEELEEESPEEEASVEDIIDFLVEDEEDAIVGYEAAEEIIEAEEEVKNKEEILTTLNHIKEEEIEHIEELKQLLLPEESREPEVLVEEHETRKYDCFIEGEYIGTVEAESEEEAYAMMEERWPEYLYGMYDGFATVELAEEELVEHVNEEHPAIESEQELEGIDNAVVKCEIADVVAHCEDEEPLEEETHARYAKPEGDRVAAYNNALTYAKECNKPFIYGYINHTGKFFALEQPIKIITDPMTAEKEFRNQYKNCKGIHVVYPDKSFITESLYNFTKEEQIDNNMDEDGNSLDSYDTYVRCNWCKEVDTKSDCVFEANLGWLCMTCQAEIRTHGGPLVINEDPSEEEIKATLEEAVKMTKDELLDKHGTTGVDLINAGRPEEERVELKED